MKAWKWIMLAFLLTITLTACGRKQEAEPDIPPPTEEQEPSEPLPEELPPEEKPGAEDVLLHAVDVELGEGVSGCLELYGQRFGENDWGIGSMTWTPAGKEAPSCTVYVRDTLEEYWGEEFIEENEYYTGTWQPDGGLMLADVNFDGYLDIGLQAYKTAYNYPRFHWAYDPLTEQFSYAFATNMLDIVDTEKKLLICLPRSGATDHYTEYYSYDEIGALYLAHRNTIRFGEETDESFNEYYDGPALTQLTAEELAGFTDHFNTVEHNGLLRFSYADLSEVALYLDILFYDDSGSAADMTAEEFTAAEAAGVFTELDMRKLTTDHILDYLQENFGIEREEAEQILELSGGQLGTYLPEYDAYYSCRGDTETQQYAFTDGCRFLDGSVQLYYTAGTLYCNRDISQEDLLLFDVPAHVQLRPDGSGGWYVTRNRPNGSY